MGKDGPLYSMPGRRKDVRVLPGKESRGPGAYNANEFAVKTKNPSYKIGSSPKGKVPDIYGSTPAPNTYHPDQTKVKNKNPQWELGTGNRPPLSQVLETPGPGAYSPGKDKPMSYTMNG